jgi:hypothetical protein
MDDNMNERRQFTGVPVSGVPEQRRIFVDKGQPGGREIEVPGLLSMKPLRPTPHGNPGPSSISKSVKAALPGLGEEKASRVRDVVARKGRG